MTEVITALNDVARYTVTNRRYIDGEWLDSKRTASVTHTIENYHDVWTGETVALCYKVVIFDHLDGTTVYAAMSEADFTHYWADRAV